MAPMCKDCISGFFKDDTPTGRETKIHGLNTYVAEPPSGSPKGIIVIVPDAFGWRFVNNRVLADNYARKGEFLVYLPDFMADTAVDPSIMLLLDNFYKSGWWANFMKIFYAIQASFHFFPFIFHTRDSVTNPVVDKFFTNLRSASTTEHLAIGAAGFCWGGEKVVKLCYADRVTASGKNLIDVGYVAHPSKLSIPNDILPIRRPISAALGTRDFQVPVPKIEEIRTILEKKSELKHEVVVYEGAKHGFAVRGDPGSEKGQEQMVEAEDQAVAWFSKWF
ncbi:MAG: hypothetical protein M1812_004594 [Candelaria pacifica]|nr:MAG: hypothetical protein M1812_004594 [Candelaria pacifica]